MLLMPFSFFSFFSSFVFSEEDEDFLAEADP